MYSLPSIVLFVWSGGIIGIVALVVVWSISNFLLEALNFMGHYGLIREAGKPVEHKHSWDNDNLFTSWFFIEIGRQGDHHVRGEHYFWELDEVGAPNYEIGYFTLFLLTLIPPVFRILLCLISEYFSKILLKTLNCLLLDGLYKSSDEAR